MKISCPHDSPKENIGSITMDRRVEKAWLIDCRKKMYDLWWQKQWIHLLIQQNKLDGKNQYAVYNIYLNTDGFKFQIKTPRLAEWIKKGNQSFYCLEETQFKQRHHLKVKVGRQMPRQWEQEAVKYNYLNPWENQTIEVAMRNEAIDLVKAWFPRIGECKSGIWDGGLMQ